MIAGAAAAIVAGGKARRLGGVTKARLTIDGQAIVERQLSVLRPLFSRVVIIANDPEPFRGLGLPVVPDALPGKGAPGGVYTALLAAGAPSVLCLGSDMPFIAASAIERLFEALEGFDAAAPAPGGRAEPLFAVYRSSCLSPFEAALRAGDPSLRGLLASVRTRLLSGAEWGPLDPEGRCLANVNTPEDLSRWGG